ncbi:MAG: hypothetical protein JXA21_02765 [Anaerolineae bacterium]|nr:hypothetical protein [Anaerolineae bacterium]
MKGRKVLLGLILALAVLGTMRLAYEGRLSSLKAQAAPLAATSGMGSAHFGLDWDVIGNGGAKMASTHFQMASTVGQAAAGNISSGHFAAHIGYWQNLTAAYPVYLPLVLRGS